jgi:hypothetical protein
METQHSQQSRPVGRPSVVTPGVVQKLQAAFQRGFSVSTACKIARISRETYYKTLKESQEFADTMEGAQEYAKILAGDVILDVLQDIHRGKKDSRTGEYVEKKYSEVTVANTAKWFVEKTEREVFGSQNMLAAKLESDGKGGQTATIVYADSNQLDRLLDGLATTVGADQISPRQLLEVSHQSVQEADVVGGGTEGRPPHIHTEELQDQHTENQSMPQP